MATQPLIDRTDVSRLITLFDRVYKLGVEDGYRHSHDEGLCREHIETTNYPGNFGLIRDGFISDEIDWQLTLQREAKVMKIYEPIRKMLIRMGAWARSNFYSCILPIAQDFYNMGVEDFLADPNADTITTFMEERRIWWGGKRIPMAMWRRYKASAVNVCAVRQRRWRDLWKLGRASISASASMICASGY